MMMIYMMTVMSLRSIDTVWMYFDATGKALGPGSASGDNGEIKRLPWWRRPERIFHL